VNIVGGLLVVVVVELEFVGCLLVIVGEKLLLELVAISDVGWPITFTISEMLAVNVVELEKLGVQW
jgi:hypothetical protein